MGMTIEAEAAARVKVLKRTEVVTGTMTGSATGTAEGKPGPLVPETTAPAGKRRGCRLFRQATPGA